jgi:alkaline phosphatase
MKMRYRSTALSIMLAGFAAIICQPSIGHAKLPVKHIILFIGDGMQLEHEVATSRYLYGMNYALSFHKLPHKANISTWDVTTYNSFAAILGVPAYDPHGIMPYVGYDPWRGGAYPYPLQKLGTDHDYFLNPCLATDSASAATAWATGYKTDAGNLAWLPGDPATGSLKTIAEILREKKGFAIGVVSTVPFTHATPAAHVSHNVSRNNYLQIADEIIQVTRPEVVIGGGHPAWAGANKWMSSDLYAAVRNGEIADYVFVERKADEDGATNLLAAAQTAARQGKKLFGLFGGKDGNFESPVPYDLPGTPLVLRATKENPLLSDATLAALKVLSQDHDGFFLMLEQGDIDWANHANDYARMIGTTWDLHRAVQTAIDFVNQPGDDVEWQNTLLIVTSDHSNSYMRLNDKKAPDAGDLPLQVPGGRCPPGYGGTCPNYPEGEVTYGSTSHTNELVRLYATGAGVNLFKKYAHAWYGPTKIIDNTHIFHVMATAAGAPQKPAVRLAK